MGGDFSVGFKPVDCGGNPAAVLASLTAKYGDRVSWSGDDCQPMFIRL